MLCFAVRISQQLLTLCALFLFPVQVEMQVLPELGRAHCARKHGGGILVRGLPALVCLLCSVHSCSSRSCFVFSCLHVCSCVCVCVTVRNHTVQRSVRIPLGTQQRPRDQRCDIVRP